MTFASIMKKLGVPENRQEGTPLNARWFLRNEAIKHRGHPLYIEAVQVAQKLAAIEK
jgi:hypothetical protein